MPIGGVFGAAFNPINLLQLATGPAGWASLAMRTIGSQIMMNAIQQVGQRMGMPQFMIDLAQANVAGQIGMPGLQRQNLNEAIAAFSAQYNVSPRDQASLEQAARFDIREFMQGIEEAVTRGRTQGSGRGRSGGNSILEVIANAMISAMNSKVGQMQGLARQMDNVKHQEGQNNSVEINTQLQVATQEFSMLMNATSNMIKTIGEGLSTVARKN